MQLEFEGEFIHIQYCLENKRLDVYLPKYKLGKEFDEYDHKYTDPNYEQNKQLIIEGHGTTVVRTNPEASNSINRLINQIYMHIVRGTKKQTDKSTKNLLNHNLSKRLLELEFKSDQSIKSKCLKWIIKKYYLQYKDMIVYGVKITLVILSR